MGGEIMDADLIGKTKKDDMKNKNKQLASQIS
jgi:hypothetical protein